MIVYYSTTMIAILFSCALLFLGLLWKKYNDGKRVRQPPPAGGALPLVGHAWMGFVKKERLYDLLLKTALEPALQRDEEVVYFRFGTAKLYVCMDPDDGCLLLNSCLKKDYFYKFFDAAFEDGLVNADEPIWKIHRKLLNPTFNQSVLDSYLVEFNEQSRQLVKLLTQEVGKEHFDQLLYVKQIVLKIVCATIMGVSVSGDDLESIKEYGKAVEIFTSCMVERIRKFYYHSEFFYSLSRLKKKHDAAAKRVHDLTSMVIRKKKEKISRSEHKKTDTPTPRFKSFLDLLLEMGEDGTLTDSEIRQEVNTFIGAGFDTTYHAIGMTLLTIGSYPEVQKKILDELQTVFEGSTRDIDKQDISRLKYLEAVIKETMRLYPVIVTVGRSLDKEVQLKKYVLPAGSRCFLSIYHMGRHSVWGADAGRFRPERWLDGSLTQNTKAYAVFGLGRRNCIGSSYAMMLMKTALCHVVCRYRISGDVTRLVQNIDVVVTPVSGHHISIEQRD